MNRVKLLLLFVLIRSGFLAFGQPVSKDVLRTDASQCFIAGDFQCAAEKYASLVEIYPKDPLYNYYLGASLCRINTDLDRAITLLDFAAVRLVPAEVVFYQGLARHSNGEYAKALEYYHTFRKKANRKSSANLQLERMIQLAEKGEKPEPLLNTSFTRVNETSKEVPVIAYTLPVKDEAMVIPDEKSLPPPPVSKSGQMPENDMAEESGYIGMLNEALKFQMRSDSLVREIEKMRNMNTSSDAAAKKALWTEISTMQTEADNLQNRANGIYSQARELELKMLQGSKKSNNLQPLKDKPADTLQATKIDQKRPVGKAIQPSDSLPVKRVYFNDFAILPQSPYSDARPVPIDEVLPDGILYKIQLGVYSKPILMNKFGGISPVSGEKIPANGTTRYYAGLFSAIGNAEKALEKVRNSGFREAFIVSFYNNKKISLIRAREIEQMLRQND